MALVKENLVRAFTSDWCKALTLEMTSSKKKKKIAKCIPQGKHHHINSYARLPYKFLWMHYAVTLKMLSVRVHSYKYMGCLEHLKQLAEHFPTNQI